jgi:Zn-finger nucleic acid-binding protein
MTELAPFRERPPFLLCPRCGEMLERALEAVLTCLRCEGIWIAKPTLERAFGDPRWPGGSSMWWRNALECPECASEGAVQTMAAVQAGDVLVDRCGVHGLWLDRTELARLLAVPGGTARGGELELLRAQLPAADADLEQLARRREAWRSDREQRRKAAQEYRAWLEAEQRRRAEREREEQARLARRMEAERERARAIDRLEDLRAEAGAHVGRVEAQIIMLREQLRAAEAELEGERARLRALEEQLAQLRGPG